MTRAQAISRLTIVVNSYSGHRLSYARQLIEHARSFAWPVTLVAPPGTRDSEQYAQHLAEAILDVREVSATDLTDWMARYGRDNPGTTIVYLDGDQWILPLLRSRRMPSHSIILVMRPEGQSRLGIVQRAEGLAKRGLRALLRRARPDVKVKILVSPLAPGGDRNHVRDPVAHTAVPDRVAEYDAQIRNAAPSAPHRYWFGIVGAITARKNIDLVAMAVAHSFTPETAGIVLAGRCADGEEELNVWLRPARDAGIPIIRINSLLSDADLDAVIQVVDCAVIAHANEGPSGILAKAAAAGTFVVAAGARSLKGDCAVLGRDAALWAPLTVEGLASALHQAALLAAPLPRTTLVTSPGLAAQLLA